MSDGEETRVPSGSRRAATHLSADLFFSKRKKKADDTSSIFHPTHPGNAPGRLWRLRYPISIIVEERIYTVLDRTSSLHQHDALGDLRDGSGRHDTERLGETVDNNKRWSNPLFCSCHLPTIWPEKSKQLYGVSIEPRNQK